MYGFAVNRGVGALPAYHVGVESTSEIIADLTAVARIYAATEFMITRETDTPANVAFAGTLEGSMRIDRSIVGAGGYGGFSLGVSVLSLINSEGLYDELADEYTINGQSITCSVGEVVDRVVAPYLQFEVFAELIAERWRVDRHRLTIETRDVAAVLDVPVQTGIYTGTGELEGTTEISGKRRPYGDGVVYNATPTQVIPVEGIWQYSTGPTASLDAVKDGGIELTFVADYATVALLRAAISGGSIPAGRYGSCIAESYFGIGGVAFSQVTCDFTGLRLTTADIVREIAESSAGLVTVDLDTSSFDRLNDAQPAEVGYFLSSENDETCRQMFSKIMSGVGGYASVTTLGVLQVGRFEAPVSVATADYESGGGNLVDVDRTDLPSGVDPPPRRRRVTYQRNWTIQTTLFGQVSEDDPARAEALAKPYQLASTPEDRAEEIVDDYPFAPDPPPVEAYFAHAEDAEDEALRLLELYTAGYKAYRFSVKNALFVHQIGEVVQVTDSRLGLSSGKYLRLVEINDDTSARITEMVGFG